jgi:hypothetical protein
LNIKEKKKINGVNENEENENEENENEENENEEEINVKKMKKVVNEEDPFANLFGF